MMLALLLAMALAEAPAAEGGEVPSAVVLVSRRTGASPGRGLEVAFLIARELSAAGLRVEPAPDEALRRLAEQGAPDSAECQGNRECVVRLAQLLGAPLVIAVEVSELVKVLSLHLEAVAVDGGEVRARLDHVGRAVEATEGLAGQVGTLVAELRRQQDSVPETPVASSPITPSVSLPPPISLRARL